MVRRHQRKHRSLVDPPVSRRIAAAELLQVDAAAGDLLPDDGGDPLRSEPEEGRVGRDLLLHARLLVLDAMDEDDVGDAAEAGVGGVDAHAVDADEEPLQRVAEDLGLVPRIGGGELQLDDAADKVDARIPLNLLPGGQVKPVVGADLLHELGLAGWGEVDQAVPDFADHLDDADVARRVELEVVDEAVPEGHLQASPDLFKEFVLQVASTLLVEREGR
eukprot:460722-Hanusia_phi.AAC.1